MNIAPVIAFFRSLISRLMSENISFLTGGVAFYGLLALFPAMAGLVSLFGLIASPAVVGEQLAVISPLFPPEVFRILEGQLASLLEQPRATLSFTFFISILLTIYSASKGTKAILAALNDVFQVREARAFIYQQAISFSLTFGALLLMVLAVFLVIAVPLMIRLLPLHFLGDTGSAALEGVRWIALGLSVFAGLFILFSIGPNRRFHRKCFRSVFWGAYISTALWLAAAVGGSLVVQIFPKVNAAYGSLSAIIALMMWLYVSAYTVLIGGAITATAESLFCDKPKPDPKNALPTD